MDDKKIDRVYGVGLERIAVASVPEMWESTTLEYFASQYGNPYSYPLIVRAKLMLTYGLYAQIGDFQQRATLAPYTGKGKEPPSILPGIDKKKNKVNNRVAVSKDELDEILNIKR